MRKMKVRAHVFINGRVQGVFFRVKTRDEAAKRNVTGWIRNTSSNRVEAIFEGEKSAVERLIDFCRRGPPSARVTGIDFQLETYTGEFKVFKIVRSV
jgi:acylphosphatase